jgi:hypothetical protein
MYKFLQCDGNISDNKLKNKIKFLEPLSKKDISKIKSDIFSGWNYEECEHYPYKLYKFSIENSNFICLGG